jgi:hypothetical protein
MGGREQGLLFSADGFVGKDQRMACFSKAKSAQ